ncbi:mechanosensitive ion channel domain-containing protein [Hoeflea poritis]|uniref:Mechanosensitive ion channel n=1 Tax=Hoeflea poritis TaxID=2993659 RepID=A0ABT4VHY5_9HYPH|nr:mechanosensitive ion channel domain-containing protein [Hoeflea poritis]MDA4844324.1 mechanosensitive ion channel [Hoeflea poritis]
MPEFRAPIALILTAALFCFSVLIGNHAIAQVMPGALPQPAAEEETVTPPPSPNDVRELMRLLSDQSMIEWLRAQSQETAESAGETDASESFRREFAERVTQIRQRLADLAVSWRNLPAAPAFLAESWRAQMTADQTLRSITYVLIFLVVGGGLEWLYRQYVQAALMRVELRQRDTLWGRVRAALMRAILLLGGLAVFSIGAIGAFLSFDWPPFVESVVLNILIVFITIRSATTLSMFVLAPRVAALRLVPMSSRLARPLHAWIVVLASIATIAFAVSDIFDHLAGETDAVGATLAVDVAAGMLCTLLTIAAIWHIARILRTAPEPDLRSGKPRRPFWPGFLTVIVVAAFALSVLDAASLMWSVLIIGLVIPVMRILNALVDHLFDQAEGRDPPAARPRASALSAAAVTGEDQAAGQEEPPAVPTPEAADDMENEDDEIVGPFELYRPVARRLARFVVLISAIFALLYAWEGNILTLSESQTITGRFVAILADILAAVLIADLVWVWAKSAIDRRLANYVPPQGSEAPGPEARMATLLPILRVTLLVFLIVIVAMTVLASLGINIGPLLAGAGVIGIAIGFGAQALVRDIVSGIFFLIDDAFRIGEYIEIGELRGTVESMSIRSLRVRHHLGAVHTIPFGELKSLTNYSRDWVIMRLEFRVPFDTDIKLVKMIVKKIGAEMLEHEGYGDSIIQTLKSQGVRRMEEFNMVVGVKFMCKPGAQWLMRRDAYQKLRDAFESNGISFAQRNVTVEVKGDGPLDEDARKAIAGAVQPAIEATQPGVVPDEP